MVYGLIHCDESKPDISGACRDAMTLCCLGLIDAVIIVSTGTFKVGQESVADEATRLLESDRVEEVFCVGNREGDNTPPLSRAKQFLHNMGRKAQIFVLF